MRWDFKLKHRITLQRKSRTQKCDSWQSLVYGIDTAVNYFKIFLVGSINLCCLCYESPVLFKNKFIVMVSMIPKQVSFRSGVSWNQK